MRNAPSSPHRGAIALSLLAGLVCAACMRFALLPACASASEAPAAAPSLLANGDLELDADQDGWPDDWPAGKNGVACEVEAGNHFLRLVCTKPGATTMYYREIPIPAGIAALELSWKQRVTGLRPGKQAWFDARIMMEFMDAGRQKVSPTPGAPYRRKDSDGWEERSTSFLVPAGATTLKFMPSLFQVQAGTYDLDDLVLRATDPAPVQAAAAERAAQQAAKQEQIAAKLLREQEKAAKLLADTGSLIPNGNLETNHPKDSSLPDGWGSPGKGLSFETEEMSGNRYLRLTSTKPGAMVMLFREILLPPSIPALEMTWKYRLSDFKRGELPWYDARFLFKFVNAEGKVIGEAPPSAATRNTDGWVEKRVDFLVPEGAVKLQWMPCLFNVQKGVYELDDVVLRQTDPAPILARKAEYERQKAARFVPDEEPNPAKWPAMLKVVGNRLCDPEGKEVWLQGVNAGGLETLPMDEQPVKSLVVAIEEWKANCVRVPMKEEFWWGKSVYQKDGGEAFRRKIDKMITLAANRGAYIVIDLHRYRAPKPEHAQFWAEFAAKYKDHPAVLFDLMNEPHGIGWEVWRNGGWVGNKEGTDESAFLTDEEKRKNQGFESVGMQGLVDAVRSTGARNVVIAGGLFWCNDLTGIVNGYALDDKGGNGVMYSWHTYNWHKGWEKVLPVAARHPIFLGEVGADVKKMEFIPADDQEDPYTWVPDMLGFIQKHRINWTGWCFHPRATPVMITDWDYTPSPFWGAFAKQALAGQTFELKRMR